jgi:hypothetical protein
VLIGSVQGLPPRSCQGAGAGSAPPCRPALPPPQGATSANCCCSPAIIGDGHFPRRPQTKAATTTTKARQQHRLTCCVRCCQPTPHGQAGAASSLGPGCKRRCRLASTRSCPLSSGGGSAGTMTSRRHQPRRRRPCGGCACRRPLGGLPPPRRQPICTAGGTFWPWFCIAYPPANL